MEFAGSFSSHVRAHMKSVALLPLGAIVVSIIACFYPHLLDRYAGAIVPLLGVVMFSMGMTLTFDDFRRVFSRPRIILLGLLLQFTCMPLLAWFLGVIFQLPVVLLAGLVLVGSCPGGTASNVICYLARGDVALSITMTSLSTMLAVILTPWITWLYIGEVITVPVLLMIFSILKIIILPVLVGIVVNQYAGRFLVGLKKYFPLISVLAIIFIIGIIVALNQPRLSELILPVILAVMLHNVLGMLLGYLVPSGLGLDPKICRTLAIEVGMQNSGLGVALANTYFSPLAALPGAVFSIWHNISGAVMAAIWSRRQFNEKSGQ